MYPGEELTTILRCGDWDGRFIVMPWCFCDTFTIEKILKDLLGFKPEFACARAVGGRILKVGSRQARDRRSIERDVDRLVLKLSFSTASTGGDTLYVPKLTPLAPGACAITWAS